MRLALIALALISAGVAVHVAVVACLNAVDQGRQVRWSATALSRLLREWGVHMLAGATIPLGAIDPGPRRTARADSTRAPVILIPGYGMNRSCLFFLQIYLRRRGFPWVWIVNNRPHSATVPRYAERLAEEVRRLQRESGARQVDLVCHSAGGVIAGWYLRQLGGADSVRRLITIGTPWKGTRTAIFGQRAHAQDLLPGSDVVAGIAGPPVPTWAIWSRTDGMMIPCSTSAPEGATCVEVQDEGHLSMLYSAAVYRLVRDLLSAGQRAPVEDPA